MKPQTTTGSWMGERSKAMWRPEGGSTGSPELSPGDHLRLLTDLLRPGQLELGRRWVAALMLVPENEREALVEAIERQIIDTYADDPPSVEMKPGKQAE